MPGRSARDTLENKILRNCTVLGALSQAALDFPANGAIAANSGIAIITKATAAAMTLAAPTPEEEGAELSIVSTTSAAHVVTATDLIEDGTTGGSKDTLTFAAFPGAQVTLLAVPGKWVVLHKTAVTVA